MSSISEVIRPTAFGVFGAAIYGAVLLLAGFSVAGAGHGVIPALYLSLTMAVTIFAHVVTLHLSNPIHSKRVRTGFFIVTSVQDVILIACILYYLIVSSDVMVRTIQHVPESVLGFTVLWLLWRVQLIIGITTVRNYVLIYVVTPAAVLALAVLYGLALRG